MSTTLCITGGAGYVGAMLIDQFSKRDDVAKIVALDKEPIPELVSRNPKVIWVQANTSDGTWQEKIRAHAPSVVIHTAWQIRELYGNRELEWKWNIEGSDAVFDFAFSESSVTTLIHFSTVASYGAFPENTIDHQYTEEEPFRESEYLYAEEKRIAEAHLKERYERSKNKRIGPKRIYIIRPAAITGPRGRFSRIRFGLQSALSGSLSKEKSFLYTLISLWVSFVPVTPRWLRQYVHEDDITDITALLAFTKTKETFEIFNAAPPGLPVLGADMAAAVGKRTVPIRPWMVRLAFFIMWHVTRGRIPTSPGSWRGYSYPIHVNGSKITRMYGYQYRYQSIDAFRLTAGRYEYVVPKESR